MKAVTIALSFRNDHCARHSGGQRGVPVIGSKGMTGCGGLEKCGDERGG